MKAIIIGAGPSGLTLAHYLNKDGYDVTVIDKAETIGGCHRVTRVDGYFSEHGPRIYVSNFVNTVKVLKDLDINFYDFFTPYKFNISDIGGSSLKNYSLMEMYHLSKAYIMGVDKSTTVAEFMSKHRFSDKAVDYSDRLCRLTDGAGIDRYTIYQFMQLVNQNTPYGIYQPTIANDLGLFKSWKNKLEQNGVKFLLNTEVQRLHYNNGGINAIEVDNRRISTNICIMAIPPRNIFTLIKNSKIMQYVGKNISQFDDWSEQTNYITYIPITFHWHNKLHVPPVYGFPKTEWGIVFIVMSDYLDMTSELSTTLISTAITRLDYISTVTGKTAHQSNSDELKHETLRQIRISFPSLPQPDKIIISPDVYRNEDGKWDTTTEAFMTTKHGYIPQHTSIPNLYNVGSHNGHSSYAFTSMEGAVQNALVLSRTLSGPGSEHIKIHSSYTLNQLIMIFVICMIVITYIASILIGLFIYKHRITMLTYIKKIYTCIT
jgi:hypothetical protein